MIVFDLECVNGHTFEGWFDDSNEFEHQCQQGLVSCPVCETTSVHQKLSAVAVRTSSQATSIRNNQQDVLSRINAKLTHYVEKNFENVGTDFAKEALKIHYGSSTPKNIRGTTTPEEDKLLNKEGVPVIKFSMPEKDKEKLN
ncbi:hypothetical protein SAMN02746065_104106 [Desulfocicer vacuolatum DSM 3385]|uniref:DUF1178 domain-containing protein n=1 Tax=Desulfocicer vacuolatum DSM 3385 TaxID=1121400 RepID=A0A1W2A4I8_9BACT|nr:DUF1178 family protein [Desulfocicer vacuolatum]SMC55556.1 hypothetical protein SAMN02746065_104106 [Desulfocicer vacuolatum DSM 3385]